MTQFYCRTSRVVKRKEEAYASRHEARLEGAGQSAPVRLLGGTLSTSRRTGHRRSTWSLQGHKRQSAFMFWSRIGLEAASAEKPEQVGE